MEIKPCLFCNHELLILHPVNKQEKTVIACNNCGYRAGDPREDSEIMIKDHNDCYDMINDSILKLLLKRNLPIMLDNFTVAFEQSGEEWVAYLEKVPMASVSAIGDSREEALSELMIVWEAMKASYRKHNEPIPEPV